MSTEALHMNKYLEKHVTTIAANLTNGRTYQQAGNDNNIMLSRVFRICNYRNMRPGTYNLFAILQQQTYRIPAAVIAKEATSNTKEDQQ